jgi:hypothetical protein
MTQTRPRLDDDLTAEVQAYASAWHISFNAAVKILLRTGLATAPIPGDRLTAREKRTS